MTQWLIEEASFAALEMEEIRMQQEHDPEEQEALRLIERHKELTAKKAAM